VFKQLTKGVLLAVYRPFYKSIDDFIKKRNKEKKTKAERKR
jgi:hypothetical protein